MSTPQLVCPVKERKVSQSASSKIDSIIRQLFLPMLGMLTPSHTSFQQEGGDAAILKQVADEHPEALGSEADFVQYMVGLYRKFSLVDAVEQSPLHAKEKRVGLADAGPDAEGVPAVLDESQRVGSLLQLPGEAAAV